MKCRQCGMELVLIDICETGKIYECGECSYTVTFNRGAAPTIVYMAPPPLDYYFHD